MGLACKPIGHWIIPPWSNLKKVSLLLLVVFVASALLMAAAPMRLVRLTVINKSAHTIYMKLEGSSVGEQFYYLTIGKGTKSSPNEETFTIVQDVYSRTTWYGPGDEDCEGWKTSGDLIATKNMKLVFLPCGTRGRYYGLRAGIWGPYISPVTGLVTWWVFVKPKYNYGEPYWGEKVTYYKWVEAVGNGCLWVVDEKSFKSPRGCWFAYQY